jgi:hypothetical protein
MKKTIFFPLLVIVLLSLACTLTVGSSQTTQGSGNVTKESRTVTGFTGVEIASSAEVTINIGESESVVVEADDNILPFIQTNVRGSTLFIETRPTTSINPTTRVRVAIMMKSLEKASITGSGDMTIDGLKGQSVTFSLPGSGNISAAGTADSVNVTLGGSGNILCGNLQARSVTVKLPGSGNVTVYASEHLVANIPGSGNIQYRGGATSVEKNVTGSGSINPIP